jgi:hypothetical protein
MACSWAICWPSYPYVTALVRRRVSWPTLALSPVYAVVCALLGAMATSLLHGILGVHGDGLFSAGTGLLAMAAVGYGGGLWVGRRRAPTEALKRGTVVGLNTNSRQHDEKAITAANVAVPAIDETKHFKFIGTTGSGKSTAIRELLTGALARGDRALIADPDGGYLNRFYDRDRGDVILNPFDERSVQWDLFAEIEKLYDVRCAASSLPGCAWPSSRP